MTVIGIHPDHGRLESYSKKWVECIDKRGVQMCILHQPSPEAFEQAGGCDGIMVSIKEAQVEEFLTEIKGKS